MIEPTPLFCISLIGAEFAVREGLAQAMAGLAPLDLSLDDEGTVELALAEALNNVVEHALAASDGQTKIEISALHDAQGLRFTIIDEGAPMPKGRAPEGKPPDLDVPTAELPEGGFGWFMLHALATEISYTRVGACNHLTLRLPIGVWQGV